MSILLLANSIGNAQNFNLDEKKFKKVEKDAKEAYFASEDCLPQNTQYFFNGKDHRIGEIYIDSLRNKKLSYGFNAKESLYVYFDSTNISYSADYKNPEGTIPLDFKDQKRLEAAFLPILTN